MRNYNNNDKYTHARTCVYNINYHIIWYTKYRKKVLCTDIAASLYDILKMIWQDKGFEVVTVQVGEGDYTHCMMSAPPKLSVTQIVKYLKGISGNTLFREYLELRQLLWRGELWSGSYFCETIGSTYEANIRAYIERQTHVQR